MIDSHLTILTCTQGHGRGRAREPTHRSCGKLCGKAVVLKVPDLLIKAE